MDIERAGVGAERSDREIGRFLPAQEVLVHWPTEHRSPRVDRGLVRFRSKGSGTQILRSEEGDPHVQAGT